MPPRQAQQRDGGGVLGTPPFCLEREVVSRQLHCVWIDDLPLHPLPFPFAAAYVDHCRREFPSFLEHRWVVGRGHSSWCTWDPLRTAGAPFHMQWCAK